MANTKISALTANTSPNWSEEFVYAYNNANGKITLNTMKTYANTWQQAALVSGTNIKTINGNDILGSWNLVISWGGGSVTTLNADANIWELSEGMYLTSYDLYYKSGEKISALLWTWATKKQMISVVNDNGTKWFFVHNWCSRSSVYDSNAAFWYSKSSSDWVCRELGRWDAAIRWGVQNYTWWLDSIHNNVFTHVITDFVDNSSTLRTSASNPIYAWLTYHIYVASYSGSEKANITLGNGVTNPLNITLPTNCTKPFHIELLATSTTTAIVTWCTIQA